MDLHEVDLLLTEASATDGRTYDEAARIGWHTLTGHLPYELAREALHAVQRDPDVRWMEPRDLLRHAAPLLTRLERRNRIMQQQLPKSEVRTPLTDDFRATLDAITARAAWEARVAKVRAAIESEDTSADAIAARRDADRELADLLANEVPEVQTVGV